MEEIKELFERWLKKQLPLDFEDLEKKDFDEDLGKLKISYKEGFLKKKTKTIEFNLY